MDWQKTGLIGGILIISVILLFRWNEFQQDKRAQLSADQTSAVTIPAEVAAGIPAATPAPDVVTPVPSADNAPATGDIPVALPGSTNSEPTVTAPATTDSTTKALATGRPGPQLITISTDTLDVMIDLYGGDIVKAVLPRYKVKLGGKQGFTILDRTAQTTYIAQSGLVGPGGTDTASGRPLFTTLQASYQLGDTEDSLVVNLSLEEEDVRLIKRFEFTRGEYLINVSYLVDNQSSEVWQGNLYGQIKRDSHQPPAAADSGFGVSPFLGAATTTVDDRYQKFTFSDMAGENKSFSIEGGWIAMVQHYFVSAWVAEEDQANQYFLRQSGNQDIYLMGFIGPPVSIAPNSQAEINSRFYVGPKDIDHLEEIAEYLDLTVDFGWLWWIAKPLFYLLDFLHDYIGNWGWSIIVLTIIVKAIFFYPSAMSYRSMARMRKVAPKMQAIKERCGDDRQKMSQEMMKLYKTEKVNPMGGCLPIIIQMPVFIALYWMLMESVELRHAPFMLWIQDLSVMDPYFIFPLIMGGTMFIQQQLNPTPPDPVQAKIMKWMPVGFTVLFLWFPAGLVIYWVTNNTLSIIQQYLITRRIEADN